MCDLQRAPPRVADGGAGALPAAVQLAVLDHHVLAAPAQRHDVPRSLAGATLTFYHCRPKLTGWRRSGCIAAATPSSGRAHRQKLREAGLAGAVARFFPVLSFP